MVIQDKHYNSLLDYMKNNNITLPIKTNNNVNGDHKTYLKNPLQNSDNFPTLELINDKLLANDLPVTLNYDESLGRYLFASRNIKQGELLFIEEPLLLCPKAEGPPTCLGCFKALSIEFWPRCGICQAPFCCKCSNRSHDKIECDFLQRFKWTESDAINNVKKLNTLMTPLKTWLLMEKCHQAKKVIEAMQSHVEKRRKSLVGKYIQSTIIPFLRNQLGLHCPSAVVEHICGVFDTNAFDVGISEDNQARALLPLCAMMNHSCVPNTQHFFVNGKCLVRACINIPEGEEVTTSYTCSLWSTQTRRQHLLLTKHFLCKCKRCEDPTELDSHISSIVCDACNCNSFLVPTRSNSSIKLHCKGCSRAVNLNEVDHLLQVASTAVSQIANLDIEAISKKLHHFAALFGTQHCIMVKLQQAYVQKTLDTIENASEDSLLKSLELLDNLLHTVSKIEPGMSRFKGIFLLNKLKLNLALHDRQSVMDVGPIVVNLKEPYEKLKSMLEECSSHLQFDKYHSQLKMINSKIQELNSTP